MIDRREVMEFSREFGLAANVIEKDYVLGWLLAGIAAHLELGLAWAFKGGTCLKKCYFETYRFSEDLDFTLTSSEHLDQAFLEGAFRKIAEWIYEASGIEVPADAIRFEVYENKRGGKSAEGRIGYRGPMGRRGDPARIKLDLTTDEVLVLDPAQREVNHPYSDKPDADIHVRCYAFEEVFAEKIRALAERERPRDLYDVVHLYRHDELRPDRSLVFATLEQKCAYKGIAVPTFAVLENQPQRVELEAEWKNMLAHQLPVLPPFQQFWEELPAVFDWLHGLAEKAVLPAAPAVSGVRYAAWRPPSMAQAWHTSAPLEVIRFAAANHLCVSLTYQGSTRLIEPYSLRRSSEGNLLLIAIKHQTGETRSYRIDRIQSAEASQQTFVPRYAIELTPSGPITAPEISRRATGIARPGRSVSGRRRRIIGRPLSSGPKYVFECSLCGKRFTRKSHNPALNPHKDKQGFPCPGRTGLFVAMK